MKVFKILIATGLALLTLVGVTLALSWQPTISRADQIIDGPNAPSAPLTLPPPFLSDDDVVDAPFDNPLPPTVDGLISPGEYAGAGKVTFAGFGGDVEAFFKQDGANLYVAVELPDQVTPWPIVELLVDTNHDGGGAPQPDDFGFVVYRTASAAELQGDGFNWVWNATITWTYGATETLSGWSAEYGIPFAKLGITTGISKVLGLALHNGIGSFPDYFWPVGTSYQSPDTWGSLVSSSDWGAFYWKPGPWEDYAPSGMPDFDQKQNGWFLPGGPFGQVWTHDGPASVANSLWWFDSKFEPEPYHPDIVTDHYRLVTTYGAWDDHYYSNTVPLVNDLAWYFDTNGQQSGTLITGTDPVNMFYGIHNYLRRQGLWDDYIVTMVMSPTFEWVADEVMRSEDVILLMGLYEWKDPDGNPGSGDEYWARVGGHYVNVAGVDPTALMIAFSDPFLDGAENGLGIIPPGRVLSGTLLPHTSIPHYTSTLHNDAGNVSHDVYTVVDTNSPGGIWGPDGYPWWFFTEGGWGANPHPFIDMEEWTGGDIQTEVELAIAVSPYTWKSSGEWIAEGDDPVMGYWQPWQDYAPNGVPDFSQKQDCWGTGITPCPPGPPDKYTFCGPVAAANSLWWFDSKFEPTPVPPPTSNDNYPLVWSYDPLGLWDDHDPLNVDNPGTPWMGPGSPGEFVEDLANYFLTDLPGSNGTHILNMYAGIDQYITNKGLRQGYVITMVESPDFWWVSEEVEVSEDVILLMGFWQYQTDHWVRLGGHYVTVPGVDKQGGLVAFSDPYYDGAEYAWPYAYPAGWPTVMGRVADGWLITHPPYHTHVYTTHNDAGNVSHDIYYASATDSPGGVWGPRGYVEGWDGNFYEQNGETTGPYVGGLPVQAEVDYALAVSPVADVSIAKGVNTDTVRSGDWLTFTLRFRNDGSLPAENVVITDTLDYRLVNPAWDYWTSNGLTVTARAGATYAWELPDLAWMEWGLITITAQVSPTLNPTGPVVVTNTASISTTSVEQYQIPEFPNRSEVTVTIRPLAFQWDKTVNGVDWSGPLTFLVETSDVITVVDAISSTAPFTLTEVWNPAHLSLVTYTIAPPAGVGSILIGPDRLVWTEPGGALTLTKLFRVEPCTWTQTLLTETLWVEGQAWQRPVIFDKQPPALRITSVYTPQVYAGQLATFTLNYTNSGGYENGVWILNRFPISVPILSAAPAPTISATNGITALWRIGDLANGAWGNIVVTVAITDAVAYPDTLDIWDGIYDHTDGLADEVTTTFEVQPTGCVSIAGVNFDWTPYPYPAAGEAATFTVISIQPFNATPPFTYQWGFGDGGSAWGDPVTHTYALSDVYTVYVTATNPCGGPVWMSHPVTVTGEPDIDVVPLSLIEALDPGNATTVSLGVINAATATANLNWHLAITPTVGWLSAPLTTGTVAPGDGDVVSVTFDATGMTPGVYTTTVEIESNDPDEPLTRVPVTLTVNCVEVSAVTLSITNTGAIYTDTVVYFSADLAPDNAAKPYDYYVSVDGAPSVVLTNTADPFVFTDTFATTGTHSVEFGAWNCSMTLPVTDVITFTVREQGACVSLDSIAIAGATSGAPGTYTFTTSYQPFDASTPITYSWDDGGVSDISVRPLGVGVHTLMVTATNSCTAVPVTDTHQIVITLPCQDVDIVDLISDSPVDEGQTMHFTATVTGDTPITYTWDLGGAGTRGGTDTHPTFDYDVAGTYTVTLNVENGCPSTDTRSIQVTVNPVCVEVSSVDLSLVTSGVIYTNTVVQFSADLAPDDADKPYSYTIDYGDSVSTTSASSADPLTALDHTFASTGTYDVVIAVWNCAMTDPVTDVAQVVVSEQGVTCVEVSSVDLNLVTSGDIYTNTNVEFSANILPDNASKPYSYTIDYGSGPGAPAQSSADPFGFTHTFPITGTYTVTFAAWNCAMTALVTDVVPVTVSEQPVICVEVTSVDLSLVTTGVIYTDTVVQFSADILPDDADKPYSYTIDYGDGVSTTAASSADPLTALDHTFTSTGTYDIVIAAWNCAMTEPVSDVVQIAVSEQGVTCVDITGVDLSLVTAGDIYTDTVVQFSANILPDNASKPYSYTIDYGSGPSASALSSADPFGFTHTFPITGTYTVTFAAWNCAMTAPVSDSVLFMVYGYGGGHFIYLPLVLRNYAAP